MKKIFCYLLFIFCISNLDAQIDAGNLLGLPAATDFTEINGIVGPQIGAIVYNLDDDQVYRFTSTGWQVINGENIYSVDGTLTGNRTVDMVGNQLNFDSDADSGSTLTLRRTNNANQIGIAFRNSGNAYPTTISLGTTTSGNSNGLDFYAGGNVSVANTLTKTLALQNNNQIQFSQYGSDTFLNNTPFRFLGVETDGDVVEVNPTTIGTDDQNASEVPLVTNIDVNGVSTDPSPADETNVEEAIQAIAPITSKAGRVFYPPSIQIDASTNGTFSINLYNEYVAQHTGAGIIRSETNGSPAPGGTAAPDIPIYNADELYYYVTFADPTVFDNIRIDGDTGEMTFDIVGRPIDFNSLINVVFVVK
ncbi:hypothetical protein [Aquimarina sp. BL5]|uniref:hypothetical protein n=1 Tax=Aquimarina sp. BL5 TaxID=1714860 RepID=UPI0018F61D5F|nr:hypothetical protein [Aquimarina sp. BL5]